MKFMDVLTGQLLEIPENQLNITVNKTKEYVLSIPHSGRLIPERYLKNIKMDKMVLLDTEFYLPSVFETTKGITVTTIINPYLVNMNRAKDGAGEEEHQKRTPINPRFLNGEEAIKRGYTEEERLELMEIYSEYHYLLRNAINQVLETKGKCLLVDCHSLNSKGLLPSLDFGKERADFVVGTLNGKSAGREVLDSFVNTLEAEAAKHDLTVAVDDPYSGGHITRKYSDYESNVHAIQVEVNKKNFMVEGLEGEDDAFKHKPQGIKLINEILAIAIEKANATLPETS